MANFNPSCKTTYYSLTELAFSNSRRITLLIIAAIMLGPLSIISNAQSAWPTSNATWMDVWDSEVPPYSTHVFSYTLGSDTIIDGLEYQMLVVGYDSLYSYPDKYFIRYDSTNQKVYYRCWGYFCPLSSTLNGQDSSEYLLYDFDLIVGDTVTLQTVMGSRDYEVLGIGIDSNYCNGRTAYSMTFPGSTDVRDTWIEGVGSDHGLFGPLKIPGIFEFKIYSICFQDSSSGCEVNPHLHHCRYSVNSVRDSLNCETPTGPLNTSSEIEDASPRINILPNPTRNYVAIKSNDNRLLNFELFNQYGQILLSGQFCQQITLDLSPFANSVYYIMLTDGNSTVVRKQIIKH